MNKGRRGQLALVQSMWSEWVLPAFLLPELAYEEIPLPGPLRVEGRRGRAQGCCCLEHTEQVQPGRASSCPQAPCPTSSKKRPSPGGCLLLSCKYQPCICAVGPVLVKSISMVVRLATLNRM